MSIDVQATALRCLVVATAACITLVAAFSVAAATTEGKSAPPTVKAAKAVPATASSSVQPGTSPYARVNRQHLQEAQASGQTAGRGSSARTGRSPAGATGTKH